jgi:hypothetical protein
MGVSAGNNTILILGQMSIATIRSTSEYLQNPIRPNGRQKRDLQVSAKGLAPIRVASSQLEWKETWVFYDMGLRSKKQLIRKLPVMDSQLSHSAEL